jgi:hypothetical protein
MSEIPGKYEVNGVIQFPRKQKSMTTGGDQAPYRSALKEGGEHNPRGAVIVPFIRHDTGILES